MDQQFQFSELRSSNMKPHAPDKALYLCKFGSDLIPKATVIAVPSDRCAVICWDSLRLAMSSLRLPCKWLRDCRRACSRVRTNILPMLPPCRARLHVQD